MKGYGNIAFHLSFRPTKDTNMIKQTITYKDFNGEERTEDFWFHLDKADLLEFQAMRKGGMKAYLNDIVQAEDNEKILDTFKMFILRSIGKRSEDGRRFIRNDDIRDEFRQTNAYAEFLFTVAGNADLGAQFVNGIMPADLEQELRDYTPQGGTVQLPTADPVLADTSTNDAEAKEQVNELPKYLNQMTALEIEQMPFAEFKAAQGRTAAGRMGAEQIQAAYRRQLSGR